VFETNKVGKSKVGKQGYKGWSNDGEQTKAEANTLFGAI